MSRKIYVGGLAYATSEQELHNLFEQHGQVSSVTIINDRDTGQSKGFGFVEMENSKDATVAIQELNGMSLGGRNIVVNEAQDKKPKFRRNF